MWLNVDDAGITRARTRFRKAWILQNQVQNNLNEIANKTLTTTITYSPTYNMLDSLQLARNKLRLRRRHDMKLHKTLMNNTEVLTNMQNNQSWIVSNTVKNFIMAQ